MLEMRRPTERTWTMLPSKMVTDRQRTALALRAAALDGAGLVTAALGNELRKELDEGETLPELSFLQELLARRLARLATAVVFADEEIQGETSDLAAIKSEKASAAGELFEALFRLRSLVTGLHGSAASGAILGLGPRLPRDPMIVQRLAERALSKVAEPGFEAPPPADGAPGFDLAATVRRLEEPAARLRRALEAESREKRLAERRVIRKRDRLDDFDRAYRGTAGMLKAMYVMAGLDELAQKVRPSLRRAAPQLADQMPADSPPATARQPTLGPSSPED